MTAVNGERGNATAFHDINGGFNGPEHDPANGVNVGVRPSFLATSLGEQST